ncbi:Dabb family protein [Croceitalea sp. MTPC9]|uniref:Dabb family protein n=1 Tax=unclassified Croceitalea TaxID=2632280 RepID=UPI002B38CED2|nr:Dabb family protein [Croceitalea sp. MTPC6]GMN15125.1 Dabb family protein [Croceitalea sp. MTPC9]
MKNNYRFQKIVILILVFIFCGCVSIDVKENSKMTSQETINQDKLLRHIVLFKFKEETTKEELQVIEKTFAALPSKISEIVDFEWGTNNSPEGLDKGFTHSFFVSFKSEKDRAIYLPHPDHKAFVEIASPHIDDVLVLDYWTK